jgi:hypothetical protein
MGVHTPIRDRTVCLGFDTASVDELHAAASQPPHGIILDVVDLDERIADPGDDVGRRNINCHRSEQFAGEFPVESLASRP